MQLLLLLPHQEQVLKLLLVPGGVHPLLLVLQLLQVLLIWHAVQLLLMALNIVQVTVFRMELALKHLQRIYLEEISAQPLPD